MGDGLRRGFKARAERLAKEIRWQLGLSAYDRLDPLALAGHLSVPVLPLQEMVLGGLREVDAAVLRDPAVRFSAVTVHCEDHRLIVYNDDHGAERTANDLAHELSHILHEHPPRPATGVAGCREWDEQYEAEATWQAGALLVPRDGALWFLRTGGTVEDGAVRFGVSRNLFRWRANTTGVYRVLGLRRAS